LQQSFGVVFVSGVGTVVISEPAGAPEGSQGRPLEYEQGVDVVASDEVIVEVEGSAVLDGTSEEGMAELDGASVLVPTELV
jgi:hypothetical protein